MATMIQSSLWFKLVGAFATVILLTLGLAVFVFYALSQGELDRFLVDNTSAVEQVVQRSFSPDAIQPDLSIQESTPEKVIAITVPMQNAIQETTAAESARFLTNLRWAALGVLSMAAVLALLTGTWLFRQITRPLARLQTSAVQLGSGQMSVRVPVTTSDEVGQVSRAFNHMADRIAAQEKLRQQMVADVAHELRTPLSVIRANLEAMLDGLISPEPQEIGEIHAEVMRLIRLTNDLRLLSLADAGRLRLQASQVDIGDLIETILRRLTPIAHSQNITLEGDLHGVSTPVSADRDKLEQAFINLLDNSLRHVPAGGRVVIQVHQRRETLIVTVRDNGPGIPPGDQPHVFERFWRRDRSRSRAGGGSGLGLAIVKQIVDLHAGTIQHDTPAGGGCRFTITLPQEV